MVFWADSDALYVLKTSTR